MGLSMDGMMGNKGKSGEGIVGKTKISVVIPVFNEEGSVLSTIEELKEVLLKADIEGEIIAVNDGSKDKSGAILDGTKGIKVIHHPYNIGYGASLKTGIKEALNELIVMVDADGTYPVKEIPRFLKYAGKYGLVSGMRVGKGAKIPLLRKPAKFILSKLANFLTGQKIPDLNCGLRLIKKSNVMQYFNILPQKFSFTITHLLACLTSGTPVKFIPIDYYKREGKSSIHPIKDFVRFNTIILRVVTYFNPFKIFSLVSVLLFLVGGLIFFYSYFILGRLMDVTIVVVLLAALQVFLFGLIADLIAKKK